MEKEEQATEQLHHDKEKDIDTPYGNLSRDDYLSKVSNKIIQTTVEELINTTHNGVFERNEKIHTSENEDNIKVSNNNKHATGCRTSTWTRMKEGMVRHSKDNSRNNKCTEGIIAYHRFNKLREKDKIRGA